MDMDKDIEAAVKRFVDRAVKQAVDAIVEESLAEDEFKPFATALDNSFKEKLKDLLFESVRGPKGAL